MGNGSVDIMSIEAVGTRSDERTTVHNGLDITIQFATKPGKLRARKSFGAAINLYQLAANEFHERIEAMRTDLFVKSLRYPRSNEKVVLNL